MLLAGRHCAEQREVPAQCSVALGGRAGTCSCPTAALRRTCLGEFTPDCCDAGKKDGVDCALGNTDLTGKVSLHAPRCAVWVSLPPSQLGCYAAWLQLCAAG